MFSSIPQESLFKLCYTYKKTIPNNESFYALFMLLKFIPLYLLTHNLKYYDEDSILFNKIFSKLILFQNHSTHYLHPSYAWISLCLFILIILAFILLIIALIYYMKQGKKTDLVKFSIPSTKIRINKTIKRMVRILFFLWVIIILCSQHIVEYLFFGIFAGYSHLLTPDAFIHEKLEQLRVFQRILPVHTIVIAIANSLSIFVLYCITYYFFLLSSSEIIKKKNGNQAMSKKSFCLWFIILFQFQGLYSINFYFKENVRNQIRFYSCVALVIILAFFNCISLRGFNYRKNPSIFIIDFMMILCFLSGVMEIILYFIITQPMSKRLILTKWFIETANSLLIIILLIKRNTNNTLRNISQRLFQEDVPITTGDFFIEFFQLLFDYSQGKNVFKTLYQTFIIHFEKCTNNACKCHILKERLQGMTYEEEKRELIRILSSIAERDIVQAIISPKKHIDISTNQLMLFHVNYLYSVLSSPYLTMYMCQYYLSVKRDKSDSQYAYTIYEVYRMNLHDMKDNKQARKKYMIDNSAVQVINQLKLSQESSKLMTFHSKIYTMNKIRKIIIIICKEYQKIMVYRQAKKNNKSMVLFTCEEFLESVMVYSKRCRLLHNILSKYFQNNQIETIEESYLLHYYYILFEGGIPSEFKEKIQPVNSALDFIPKTQQEQNNTFIILFLSISNEFIIQNISISLLHQLNYIPSEIIDTNIHNNLLNFPFEAEHFAQMKMFVINNTQKIDKDTFLLTKEQYLHPVHISVRSLPTKLNPSLIIKVFPYDKELSSLYLNGKYFAYLDNNFRFLSTCLAFEKRFVFNAKLLYEARVDYIQFFGISDDKKLISLSKHSNQIDDSIKKLDTFYKFNKLTSIQTTIKNDDRPLYYNDHLVEKKVKKVVTNQITRKLYSRALEKIKLILNGMSLDKAWEKSIHDLHAEATQKNIFLNRQYGSIKDIMFDLKLTRHNISNHSYYIAVINEHRPDNKWDNNKEGISNQMEYILASMQKYDKNLLNGSINQSISLSYEQQQRRTTLNALNKSTTNVNDSVLPLFSNIQHNKSLMNNHHSKLVTSLLYASEESKELEMAHLKTVAKILKYSCYILLALMFGLSMIKIIVNQTTNRISKDLFYIQNYFFMILADIIYTGSGCLRSCLIINDIIPGNYTLLQSRINIVANDLIKHFSQLTSYVNNNNQDSQIKTIYDHMYTIDTYSVMQPNGKIKERKSVFSEEIYQLYYMASFYNPSTPDKCRIKQIFYLQAYRNFGDSQDILITHEERTLYYVFNNIITVFGGKLSVLNKETNKLLNDYNNISQITIIALTSCIICIGILFYLTSLVLQIVLSIIFRRNMNDLFDINIGEQLFHEELVQYTDLVMHFSYQNCLLYEKKRSSVIELPKTTTISPRKSTTKKYSAKEPKSSGKPFKDLKKDAKNINEEQEAKLIDNFNNFAKLRKMNISIVLIILLFVIFITIQIMNIVFSLKNFNEKLANSSLTISFLSRSPKIGELVLYSAISFLSNNQYHITKEPSDYESSILSNFYNSTLDIANYTMFQNLGNSLYAFIYYEQYIATSNILATSQDITRTNILPYTREADLLFNENKNFCIYSPLYYVLFELNPTSLVESFKEANLLAQECKRIAGGSNLSGCRMSIDFHLQQLTDLYIGNFKLPSEKRTIENFFGNYAYSYIDENCQISLKFLHKDMLYLVEKDMIESYLISGLLELLWSLLTIFFSVFIAGLIIMIYLILFEKYNNVLEAFYVSLKKVLKYHSN